MGNWQPADTQLSDLIEGEFTLVELAGEELILTLAEGEPVAFRGIGHFSGGADTFAEIREPLKGCRLGHGLLRGRLAAELTTRQVLHRDLGCAR